MTTYEEFAKKYPDAIQARREFAMELYRHGNFIEAIKEQHKAVAQAETTSNIAADEYNRLASYYYAVKDFTHAAEFYQKALTIAPNHSVIQENLSIMYFKQRKYQESHNILIALYEKNPDNININDMLSATNGLLGKLDDAKFHGEKSLTLKDKLVHQPDNLQAIADLKQAYDSHAPTPKPFSYDDPSRNVIAFSLWGNHYYYIQGALLNALYIRHLYPGWTARFYYADDVPQDTITKLAKSGAQMVKMGKHKGAYQALFWRFHIAHDRDVDRFLIRDTDSVVTCQERLAVDEWLRSDKAFHIIRDFYTHTDLILAGLWGGVGGCFPDLTPYISKFYKTHMPERTIDQQFLRYNIWPLIKDNVLIHDSCHRVFNAKDFALLGHNPSTIHVGLGWTKIPYLPGKDLLQKVNDDI